MTGIGGEPAVQLRGVTAGWVRGRPVLEDLDLEIAPRGVTLVAGGNGSGKSTLVEVLSGYLRPWQGEVRVAGLPAHDARARKVRRVVRTQPRLFGDMLAEDHLRLFARTADVSEQELHEQAASLGLTPYLCESARSLSSGTAKKLWYVVCAAGSPRVLVLDEPFNAVDADGVAILVGDIRRRASTAAVLLVSHAIPDGLPVDAEVRLTRAP